MTMTNPQAALIAAAIQAQGSAQRHIEFRAGEFLTWLNKQDAELLEQQFAPMQSDIAEEDEGPVQVHVSRMHMLAPDKVHTLCGFSIYGGHITTNIKTRVNCKNCHIAMSAAKEEE